ncbi:tripartite tricarboxylate transporter TctB family protein [Rhabdaerophilum sp.]|uniref:tripartite tricarboxylate transporter TctB family protein n=1 Tax=Rhabdaerophilum sp. TaxID=2717341 RepID=UPI0038D3D683
MKKDLAAGIALLCLSAGYAWMTRRIPSSSLSDGVGPEGLPNLLAIALAIVAVALIGKSLLALRLAAPVEARAAEAKASGDEQDAHAALPRALAFVGLGIGYMVIAPWTGFAVGIALLVMATALFEGAKPSPRLMVIAALVGLGFWLVFVRFLGVEQPVSRLIG